MAHFAELDSNNVVLRVIVVDNKNTSDENGVEKEEIGAAFCKKLLGGRWVQTSYNGNFRKIYAGVGCIYDEKNDVFLPSQPYPSWTFNEITHEWQAPIPLPNDHEEYQYLWNEEKQQWDKQINTLNKIVRLVDDNTNQ